MLFSLIFPSLFRPLTPVPSHLLTSLTPFPHILLPSRPLTPLPLRPLTSLTPFTPSYALLPVPSLPHTTSFPSPHIPSLTSPHFPPSNPPPLPSLISSSPSSPLTSPHTLPSPHFPHFLPSYPPSLPSLSLPSLTSSSSPVPSYPLLPSRPLTPPHSPRLIGVFGRITAHLHVVRAVVRPSLARAGVSLGRMLFA